MFRNAYKHYRNAYNMCCNYKIWTKDVNCRELKRNKRANSLSLDWYQVQWNWYCVESMSRNACSRLRYVEGVAWQANEPMGGKCLLQFSNVFYMFSSRVRFFPCFLVSDAKFAVKSLLRCLIGINLRVDILRTEVSQKF